MIGEDNFIENIHEEKISSVDELHEKGTMKICNISQRFCKVQIDCCKVFKNCKSQYIIMKGRKIIKAHYMGADRCGAIQSKVFMDPLFITIPGEHCMDIEICNV